MAPRFGKEGSSFFRFIYFREREGGRKREHKQGGADGEGERESQADATPSTEPDVGLDLTTQRP